MKPTESIETLVIERKFQLLQSKKLCYIVLAIRIIGAKDCSVNARISFRGITLNINLYRAVTHLQGWSGLPYYEIRNGAIYRTISHPEGWSGFPDYEIRNGLLYSTIHHPLGWGGLPDYEIRNQHVYRTVSHPQGWSGLPDYEFR